MRNKFIDIQVVFVPNENAVEDTFKIIFSGGSFTYSYTCYYPSGYCYIKYSGLSVDDSYSFKSFGYLSNEPNQTYSLLSTSFGSVNYNKYNYFDEKQTSQSFISNDSNKTLYVKLSTPGVKPDTVYCKKIKNSKGESDNYTMIQCDFKVNDNSYIECKLPNGLEKNKLYALYYKEICDQFYESKKQFSIQDIKIESITYTTKKTCGVDYTSLVLTLSSLPNDSSSDKIFFRLVSGEQEILYDCLGFKDRQAYCNSYFGTPQNNTLTYKKGSLKSSSKNDSYLGDWTYDTPLIIDRTVELKKYKCILLKKKKIYHLPLI